MNSATAWRGPWGPNGRRLSYRVKALLDAGLEIPASTDAPVVSADPILNIHDLVNRRTSSGADFVPEERITVAQAVRAYTVGSAYAAHEDHDKGTLSHGMLADFVVLSEDIYEVPAGRHLRRPGHGHRRRRQDGLRQPLAQHCPPLSPWAARCHLHAF